MHDGIQEAIRANKIILVELADIQTLIQKFLILTSTISWEHSLSSSVFLSCYLVDILNLTLYRLSSNHVY